MRRQLCYQPVVLWLQLVVTAHEFGPAHGFGCGCHHKRRHTTPIVIRADPSLSAKHNNDFSARRRFGFSASTTSRCRFLLLAPLHSSSSSNNRRIASSSSSSSVERDHNDDPNENGAAAAAATSSPSSGIPTIRLNKVFKSTHSRREADRLILDGRVKVNGMVSYGCMVTPYQDTVQLDGVTVDGWEQMNNAARLPISSSSSSSHQHRLVKSSSPSSSNSSVGEASLSSSSSFEYIKYWKPRGVTCTTDSRVTGNIIDHLTQINGYRPRHRVYPVGRLDKDTTGLILLTSDGRLPNASLRYRHHQPKVYDVTVDRPVAARDVQKLRDGVVITTIAQRDGRRAPPLTAPTRPCLVEVMAPNRLTIMLTEGRNRQIRKMLAALNYTVVALHRKSFGNITLRGLHQAGDWCRLTGPELAWVQSLLVVEE
jgi:23S rRNA pseudouridine2604 synthase